MGGSVNVTVRRKDGSIVRMCRWTNSLPYWFSSAEFYLDPDARVEEYIKVRGDSIYHYPEVELAPDCYGLVVIDCLDRKIYSMQGYTSLDKCYVQSSLAYLNTSKFTNQAIPFLDPKISGGQKEDIERVYKLLKEGLLAVSFQEEKVNKQWKNKIKDGDTWKHLIDFCAGREIFGLQLDIKLPFELITFDEYVQGAKSFRQALIDAKFNLTEKDDTQWNIWIEDRGDYSEETEDEV